MTSLLKAAAMPDPRVVKQLENFGPPREWSGAVAAIAGPDACKAMKAAWAAMTPEERKPVYAAFERNFDRVFGKSAESPEKKKALRKVDFFHGKADKDWDAFLEDAGRKSFVAALKDDPRSDEKLKLHADMMNRLQTGKPVAGIKGNLGNYEITHLRGGGLGCTCNDWRFRRSVAPEGKRDCKHIKGFRQEKGEKVASFYEMVEPLTQAAQGVGHWLSSPGAVAALTTAKVRVADKYLHPLMSRIPGVSRVLEPVVNAAAHAGLHAGASGRKMMPLPSRMLGTIADPHLVSLYENAHTAGKHLSNLGVAPTHQNLNHLSTLASGAKNVAHSPEMEGVAHTVSAMSALPRAYGFYGPGVDNVGQGAELLQRARAGAMRHTEATRQGVQDAMPWLHKVVADTPLNRTARAVTNPSNFMKHLRGETNLNKYAPPATPLITQKPKGYAPPAYTPPEAPHVPQSARPVM